MQTVNASHWSSITFILLACALHLPLAADAYAAAAGTNGTPAAAPADAIERDPFWPVGYVPRTVQEAEEEKVQEIQEQVYAKALIKWPELLLTGITKVSGRNIGLIRGVGLVEAGDKVRMQRDGVEYKWHILEVSEAGLAIQKLSATPLPLKKPRTGATQTN